MATAPGLPRTTSPLGGAVAGALSALLAFVGVWTAVLVPALPVALLAVRPDGWLAMATGLFALDGLAVLVGHHPRLGG